MKIGDLIMWREWLQSPALVGIVTCVGNDGYIDVLFGDEEFCISEEDCEVVNEDW